jgi:hypothetical protein
MREFGIEFNILFDSVHLPDTLKRIIIINDL